MNGSELRDNVLEQVSGGTAQPFVAGGDELWTALLDDIETKLDQEMAARGADPVWQERIAMFRHAFSECRLACDRRSSIDPFAQELSDALRPFAADDYVVYAEIMRRLDELLAM